MGGKRVLTVAIFVSIILIAALSPYFFLHPARSHAPVWINATRLRLPEPRYESEISVEEALLKRRSVREYASARLTLQEVSQLLWAAKGITDPQGLRTAPSAGALYPLEVYLIVGDVGDLAPGVYKYVSEGNEVIRVLDGDKRVSLAEAARSSMCEEYRRRHRNSRSV